ncbi:hypothetical protein [Secundilactobacillus folii]|uniref:Uncharacterized protein n=1 Tax=Secundilactobacillus folii TaxID=2678357 RepID=A0A7X2XX18_9LACO|nr:hypothetical protein [Secundilactobacillus folii]MTV83227.1 hypothetical protein [Secundilactobacillus folii]
MWIDKQRKTGFILSDALIGLIIICLGVVLYVQTQQVMTHQLSMRQVQVQKLRHTYEFNFQRLDTLKKAKKAHSSEPKKSQKSSQTETKEESSGLVDHASSATKDSNATSIEGLPKSAKQVNK